MQGRAGLVGPGTRAPQNRCYSFPGLQIPRPGLGEPALTPFPSLQTHLRHLSSARPHQLRRAGALGPEASAAHCLWFPWGVSGTSGPSGRLNHSFHRFAPLSSSLAPEPQHLDNRTTHLLLSCPHTQSLAGVLLVWLSTHLLTNSLSCTHLGRRLRLWGATAHSDLSTHPHM